MSKLCNTTIALFDAVPAKSTGADWFIDPAKAIAIHPDAVWAKDIILKYAEENYLDARKLNATFHKSWETIQNLSRGELWLHQIRHYISTYGTDFSGEVYLPPESSEIPEVASAVAGLKLRVITALSEEALLEKVETLLYSGIALKQETILNLFVLVKVMPNLALDFKRIKNKEFKNYLFEHGDFLPDDPTEFLRFLIYKKTGETLLIKNYNTLGKVGLSEKRVSKFLKKFPPEKMATIFNRFKPLFLELKKEPANRKYINRISKLSKKFHEPLVQNPLNQVTTHYLRKDQYHWLDNATSFALLNALNICHLRSLNPDYGFYKIRNGKSWVKELDNKETKYAIYNYKFLAKYIKIRFHHLKGKSFHIPGNITYGLPVSEKKMIGNIPFGTKFSGKNLMVGIYWENEWGARDLDISALSLSGKKIGWNAHYSQNGIRFSGDMTDARNGAVEYLYFNEPNDDEFLVINNVYYGDNDTKYKIVIGNFKEPHSRKYMMNPKNLVAEIPCQSVQKQTILGIFQQKEFICTNLGFGNISVSYDTEHTKNATAALTFEAKNSLSLNEVLTNILGCSIINRINDETVDYDLSLSGLGNQLIEIWK